MINLTKNLTPTPTFVINAGGSGCKVGRNMKAMLDALPNNIIKQFLVLLVIDAYPPPEDLYPNIRHYFYSNFVKLLTSPLRSFIRMVMPRNKGEVLNDTSRGAGVTPWLGALSLACNIDAFVNDLREAYQRMKKALTGNFSNIQVFITFGSGGTGRGMAIFLAILCKYYLKKITGRSPSIYFFFIGPDILEDDPNISAIIKNRMMGLTYSLLKADVPRI